MSGRNRGWDIPHAGDGGHPGAWARRYLWPRHYRRMFGLLVAPVMQHALRFFPSVVTGTIITMIGHFVDAGWYRLGRRGRRGGGLRSRRRLPGDRCSRAVCDPADHKVRHRLSAEYVSAGRHHRWIPHDNRSRLAGFLRHPARSLGSASCFRCSSGCPRSQWFRV